MLSRREVLAGIAGLGAALLVRPASGQPTTPPKRPKRVFILGGGFAGIMVALTLRKFVPQAEVFVVEKSPVFISAPAALDYVFGIASWTDIVRGYDSLGSRGIGLVRAEVQAIEPERQVVRTTAGTWEYAILVLATGIRLASEEINGLKENPEANAGLYDRPGLGELRRRVEAYQGGTVVLSVPPPPLQCPPAPYEFALLFAERIRQKKLAGKIVLLDANTNPQPPPLSGALEAALRRNQDLIEYVPSARVAALDAAGRKVVTADREEFAYDLLALIPPHGAARFIQEAGLSMPGDPFVEVDPLTFRSEKFETIYAMGDAARTPYARTASSANASARICAHQIARALGAGIGPSLPEFRSVCYPYVNRGEALSLKLDYRVTGPTGSSRVEGRAVVDTDPRRAHVEERRAWERGLLGQMFGT